LRRTRIAYKELEHEANSELTWSAAANLISFNTTPSDVRLCTWLMPRQGAGSATDLARVPRPVNIISLDFRQFNVRLLSSAQLRTCVISLVAVLELAAGTIMYVSSANLNITLPAWTGWRSDAMTTNEAGRTQSGVLYYTGLDVCKL